MNYKSTKHVDRAADTGVLVIIPVKDGSQLLRGCLESVRTQLGPQDMLLVVDDASTDGTHTLAESYGATVIPNRLAPGPYGARQTAIFSSIAEDFKFLVFFDVRCRAEAGWLETHRRALLQDGVNLSYSSVAVVKGRGAAALLAYKEQFFAAQRYATHNGNPPHFPTCNLGVARAMAMKIGGFKMVRGGADADFCWRIIEAFGGQANLDYRVFVRWVPRDRYRDLLRQFFRYGTSYSALLRARKKRETGLQACLMMPLRVLRRTIRRTRLGLMHAIRYLPVETSYQLGYLLENPRRRD